MQMLPFRQLFQLDAISYQCQEPRALDFKKGEQVQPAMRQTLQPPRRLDSG